MAVVGCILHMVEEAGRKEVASAAEEAVEAHYMPCDSGTMAVGCYNWERTRPQSAEVEQEQEVLVK